MKLISDSQILTARIYLLPDLVLGVESLEVEMGSFGLIYGPIDIAPDKGDLLHRRANTIVGVLWKSLSRKQQNSASTALPYEELSPDQAALFLAAMDVDLAASGEARTHLVDDFHAWKIMRDSAGTIWLSLKCVSHGFKIE